jgi:hypothetical protein
VVSNPDSNVAANVDSTVAANAVSLPSSEQLGGMESTVVVERGQTVAAQNIRTEAFVVHASRDDIANFAREGNSLIVEFNDGAKLRIDDFFTRSNQLVFVEGGQPYLADLSNALSQGGDGIADESIQWYRPAEGDAPAPDGWMSDSSLTLLSVLGVGAGAGLIYYNRHHHSSGSNSQEPPPAPDAPASYIDHARSNTTSTAPTTVDANPSINIGPLQDGQTANLYVDGQMVASDFQSQSSTLTPRTPLTEGSHDITYTVSDSNGNESAQSAPLTITIETAPKIVIDGPIAGDSVIDAQEAGALSVSGETVNVEDGQTVTVTISDGMTTLTATTQVSGDTWSIAPEDISKFNNGDITVIVSVSDQAGNTVQSTEHAILDNSITGAPAISIQGAADSGVVLQRAGDLTINGNTAFVEDGQTVTVTLSDGSHTVTATAQVNGNTWSTTPAPEDISTLTDGDITVAASVSDMAGNLVQAAEQHAKLDSTAGTSNDAPVNGGDVVNTPENTASAVGDTPVSNDNSMDGVTISPPLDVTVQSTGASETFDLGSGGDTVLYKLLSAADATGGNGFGQVDNFNVGAYGEIPQASRIDISELLTDYRPANADGPAHYVDGKATIDAGDTIQNYLKVATDGNGNTIISIDRDGAGTTFQEAPLVTLNHVETDLATLLANHQIVVSHG